MSSSEHQEPEAAANPAIPTPEITPPAPPEPVVESAEPVVAAEPSPEVVEPVAEVAEPEVVPAAPPRSQAVRVKLRERLANASVGKPYSQKLRDLFGDNHKHIVELSVSLPPDSGLELDAQTDVLHGTPTTPGEKQIALTFRVGTQAAQTHTLALTVNPDPSSLWKNLPSDANGAFAKPDTAKAFLATPHLNAIAASLRGRSHAHEGKYREDDFGLKYIEATSWHILISADGAGYAKFSRKGSQLASQTAVAEITEKLGSPENPLNAALAKLGTDAEPGELETLRKLSFNVLMPAAYEAVSHIHKQAKESQLTLRDFATTFICVIARRLADRWFLASFDIGDGGAGVVMEDGRAITLSAPDSGDFAGQTVFLTMQQVFADSEKLLARTQAQFCSDFKFLAAMSDGITDPIFQNDATFASDAGWEKFRLQLAAVIDLKALAPGMEDKLLDWLNFPSPGNHDDRTLLIAVPTTTQV